MDKSPRPDSDSIKVGTVRSVVSPNPSWPKSDVGIKAKQWEDDMVAKSTIIGRANN